MAATQTSGANVSDIPGTPPSGPWPGDQPGAPGTPPPPVPPPPQWGTPGPPGPPGPLGPPRAGRTGGGPNIALIIAIVAVIAVVVGGIFFLVSGDDDDSTATDNTNEQSDDNGGGSEQSRPTSPPTGDTQFDGLAQSCFEGSMPSCDELYNETPAGSDYEEYGDTCGGRWPTSARPSCTEVISDPLPPE